MKHILAAVVLFFSWIDSYTQCGSVINTFPYSESFENGIAGWNSGGLSSDWALGAPSKSFITNAGAGTACWVTGGLNNSFYNYGQRSYVTSPCFDFTNLQYPHIKMKIYWEGENQYDGTTFQFSLNNGTTWNNVGTNTDPIDCLNENWFNQSNINALSTLASPRNGWAGTVQSSNGGCFGGNGSGSWVTAQHCMNNLAGQPNVMFRFAFGAGTVCNDFDGFAFDDIVIGNAPANVANFNFSCTSNSLEYNFNNTSAFCPTNFSWNFGDPSSGLNNVSNASNPTHLFTSPGTYNVTLTVAGPCNQNSVIVKTITTMNGSISATSPLCANQNTGSINMNVSGNNGPVTYTLQPGNITNSSGYFNPVSVGNYSVQCTDVNGCSISSSISITSPSALNWNSFQVTDISCNGAANGVINTLATGGTGALIYTLFPNNISNSTGSFTSLIQGTYTIQVTDANNCSIVSICTISEPPSLTVNATSLTHPFCFNESNGIIQAIASGGNSNIVYTLSPTMITNSSGNFTGLQSGTYSILATDSKGCSASTSAVLLNPSELVILALNTTPPSCLPGNDGSISILASGGSGNLIFSYGGVFSSNNSFAGLPAGNYTITVKDANNCSKTSVISLQNPNAPVFNPTLASDITCNGLKNGIIIVNASSSSAIQNYLLQPTNISNNIGQFNNLSAANYTITATDAQGCSSTTSTSILEPLPINLEDILFHSSPCGDEFLGTLKMTAKGGTGNLTFQLNPNAIMLQFGEYKIKKVGTYLISIKDTKDCSIQTNYTISEKICCDNVIIPNVFSPNNDSKNDELKLLNTGGINLKKFTIYNRWGQCVFDAQHIDDRWNGTFKGIECPIGNYFYFIEYKCLNDNQIMKLKGDVLLMR